MSYTVAVFSSVTIYTAINLNILSGCYIDNREFPAIDGVLPPGPFGYQAFTYSGRIESLSYVTFLLNNWLADGLLVSSISGSYTQVSNTSHSSCTVAVLFMT